MTAKDRAYAFTKGRVLDSTFAGGHLITEGEVADALGMSRTPVREAFLRLEGEGLLRLYPKRGALVVPVSIGEVEAVMETRMLVERFALDKVLADGPAPAIADELLAAIAQQEEYAAAGDTDGFVAVDREFHTTFVTAAGNPIVTGLYDSLRDRQQRMVITSLLRDAKRIASILVEHRALTQAIRDGDLPRADGVLVAHLRGTLELVRPRSAPALSRRRRTSTAH
jgi:DNA-binding GntR family transcriptional regulator